MQFSGTNAVLKQALGALFCAAISFFLTLFLARQLGTGTFGEYASTLNGAALGLILLEGGWTTWLCRERALADDGAWRRLMAYGLAHTIIAACIALALSIVLASESGTRWGAAWVCMAAVAVMNLISARMRGEGFFGYEALWQAAGRVVSAVLILTTLWLVDAPTVASVFWSWAVGLLLVVGVGTRTWLVWPRWHGLWHAYPKALAFIVLALVMAWLLKGDMVVLGQKDPAGLGRLPADNLSWYAACSRIVEMGLLLYAPLGNVLLQWFHPEDGTKTPKAEALLRKMVLLVTAFGWGLVAAAFFLGEMLMTVLFGAAYAPAGALLPWVLLMLPFALTNLVLVQWLTVQHKERATAIGLAIAGGVMWVCLREWGGSEGGRGAAVAVAGTHAGLMCGLWLLATRLRR